MLIFVLLLLTRDCDEVAVLCDCCERAKSDDRINWWSGVAMELWSVVRRESEGLRRSLVCCVLSERAVAVCARAYGYAIAVKNVCRKRERDLS